MSLKLLPGSRSLVMGRSLAIDKYFAEVIASFANDRAVVYGGGKGDASVVAAIEQYSSTVPLVRGPRS
jgi:hypothetical protein